MIKRLYVGNLNYQTNEEELKDLFSKFGEVQSVSLIKDKYTGKSKGFGFVEMSEISDAQKAIALHGTGFMGRNLTVAEAKPQEKRTKGSSSLPEERFEKFAG